jgi:hypothetical protein
MCTAKFYRKSWWLPSDKRSEKVLRSIDKLWKEFFELEDKHMDNGYPASSHKKLSKLQDKIAKLLTPAEREECYGEMENFGLY